MNFKQRIEKSRTTIVRTIFPGMTNHYNTLFGGTALQWMDEVSFITATRFTRQTVVTVSSSQVDFKIPIPEGSIVELIGEVKMLGKSSLTIEVQIYVEDIFSDKRMLAIQGDFTFVAIDKNHKPINIENHLSNLKTK